MSKRIALSNFSTENTSLQVSLSQNAISLFEDELENYLGENVLVTALNSGTAAIHIALQLLDVCKGDPIICQSFTYIATVNPVMYLNATPIFVDSEKDTWNMCPVRLEEAICSSIKSGNKPKAILFVHTYGMPAKMNEIIQVAKKYSIPLVEDAAEALGSEYDGQKCGTFGDFGILSFNNNKIITTFGGGALVCKSKKNERKSNFFSNTSKKQ
ncbi:DegT/DnrJ/EryC1/StrS family aminotransferase [Polaribacter tangerinus]|uniref:DegT/DnrJ/EryC1/StrS family aminotransferase n=1 Tax=Polaribacter tangerinus TaxID=1920034 RepID=UPI000B4AD077|nr:DegT/DnrJ/EryC1/StrS family aminotransferase [Polaribacter tangerinus]